MRIDLPCYRWMICVPFLDFKINWVFVKTTKFGFYEPSFESADLNHGLDLWVETFKLKAQEKKFFRLVPFLVSNSDEDDKVQSDEQQATDECG